jgi:DNA-binding NarL/FixJ family response regulator
MSDHSSSRRLIKPSLGAPSEGLGRLREPMGPGLVYNSHPNHMGVETPLRREPARRDGERTSILIADDHPIFRDGLRRLIQSQPGLSVTGESSVGADVVRLARELKPDILILDLGLPRRTGLQVLNSLASSNPTIRTLAMAEAMEEDAIVEAFYLGARGIVLKESPREVLIDSIRCVVEGKYWLDHKSVPIVIQALRKSLPSQNGGGRADHHGLTPCELKIVGRIANGSSNKELGVEFNMSERTVKHHLTNIFNKLGISGRVALAVFALENGLVDKGLRGTDEQSVESLAMAH